MYRHVLLMALIFCGAPLTAQTAKPLSPDKNLWISLLAGPARSGAGSGMSGSAALQYAGKENLYTVEYLGHFNFASYPFKENREYNLVNVMYGGIKRYEFFKISYSAGLSLARIAENHNERVRYGVPLSVQLVLTPLRIVGLGIKGYLNIIPGGNSLAGMSVGLYFGKVR